MIRCTSCGTNNIDGSEYCDECGMRLAGGAPVRQSSQPPVFQPPSAVPSDSMIHNTSEGPPLAPPSFTNSMSVPKPALPARKSPAPEPAGKEAKEGTPLRGYVNSANDQIVFPINSQSKVEFPAVDLPPSAIAPPDRSPNQGLSAMGTSEGADSQAEKAARAAARLIIQRGGRVGKEFYITGVETNIGRWDADSGIFPDIDLDEDDPEAKISRRHARILNHNAQFFIEDLGSTNGTFINRGRRLLPGKRHLLQNGDEVIIGKTFLKFQISQ